MRTVGRRERATEVSGDGRLGSYKCSTSCYKCSTSSFSSCVGSGKRLDRCTRRRRDRVAFESRLAFTACISKISTIFTISAIASSATRCWRTRFGRLGPRLYLAWLRSWRHSHTPLLLHAPCVLVLLCVCVECEWYLHVLHRRIRWGEWGRLGQVACLSDRLVSLNHCPDGILKAQPSRYP